MILDCIEHAAAYHGLGRDLAAGLRFLTAPGIETLALGRHAIDGDRVFALVQRYDTCPRSEGVWEAHRRFIDIQYVVSGIELLGVAPLGHLSVHRPYAEDKDVMILGGNGDFVVLPAGRFALLFPWDAHMPGRAITEPAPVFKIVVKVAAET